MFERVKECFVGAKKAKRPRVALVCTVGTGLKESERQLEQTETRVGQVPCGWPASDRRSHTLLPIVAIFEGSAASFT